MRYMLVLALALAGCGGDGDDDQTESKTCFSPTRPQADMSPGKGCVCNGTEPDVVVNLPSGPVTMRCQGVFGQIPESRWFVVDQ